MPSFSEVVSSLPYRLRLRFDSLGAYVKNIVEEREEDVLPEDRLGLDQVQFIQLTVFIYALNSLFQEGTRGATLAVDEFARLGLAGFKIGKTVFEGRNENVMQGERLANALKQALADTPILPLIKSATGVKSLTLQLINEVRNGGAMD